MGTIVFWCVFFGLVLVLIISNINRSRMLKEKRTERIKSYFGKKREPKKDYNLQTKNIDSYYKYLSKQNQDSFYIDDITWNDLNLDIVFDLLNTTFSSCGEEILYSKLRMIYKNGDKANDFFEKSLALVKDENVRISVSESLDKLGKVKGISSFDILLKLFSADKEKATKDIITDVLLIISFALVFIKPALGMIAFLLMLVISISSYFKAKAIMSEYLRAFNYALRLIKCSKEIGKIIGDNNDYTCDTFKDIGRFSFLISGKDGTTSNPLSIIMDYIRMIFHVDIISYNRKLKLIIENSELITKLYEYVGNIDANIAIASYVNSMEYYCRPGFSDETVLDVIDMFHPLTGKIVANSIYTKKGVLITGSNASGKSTFLKMIGINVIFAQSFGFALAKEFTLSPFRLYSSMALKDDLLGKESYYVVETRSLKRICDVAKENERVLCIVDEVLRGTNTVERIASSCEILSYLADTKAICFVATHDVELTELLKDKYELYFFAEEMEDGNIVFPYKINKGVSKAGNAIKLLEMMGYERTIINGALTLVDGYNSKGKWEREK